MKKFILIVLGMLIATSCYALDQVSIMSKDSSQVITPAGAGSTLSATNPVITTANGALQIGTTTGIGKILISTPVGTAWIGDSTVKIGIGLAWAATQGVMTLDLTDASQVYWTGPSGQKLNVLILK